MCFLLRAALCSFVVSRCAATTVQDGACPAQTGADDVNLELRSGGTSLLQARIIGEADATSSVSVAQPWIVPPPELEPWSQPSQPGVVSQLDLLEVGELPIKRLHVLSIGRQGSCFIAKLLQTRRAGPYLFEPLRGLEGKIENPTTPKARQSAIKHGLRCMYDCHTCIALDVNTKSFHKLQNYCSQTNRTEQQMLIKTIRVPDLAALRDVPRPQLLETRFVVLYRDPRAVWCSIKRWIKKWKTHHIHMVCEAAMLQAFTLPELASTVGPERIMVAIFEQWSMEVESFARFLAAFVRATPDEATKMVTFAKSKQKPIEELNPPTWASGTTNRTLSPSELGEIEGNTHCAAYMDRLGYRTFSEGIDYSGLRSSSDLLTDLLPSQAALLSELRATQAQGDGSPTGAAKLVFDPSGAAALAESVEG